MKTLSENIRVIQLVNLLILVLMFLIAIIIAVLKSSIIAGVPILLIGLLFWGPVFFLYLKLFEIEVSTDRIIVLNLFKKYQFKRKDFEEIHASVLPLIYKISFKGANQFHFMIPVKNVFSILFTDRAAIVEKMRLLITS